MSVKSVTQPYPVIRDGDMSVDVTSLATTVSSQDNAGYQVMWTGTPTGTFSIEATIDGTNWEALSFTPSLTAPSGAAGSFLVNLNQLPYYQVRLRYEATSGSGTLQASVMVKRLGG